MRNAQQTIYRLYFGAFGTQWGRLFDSGGGGGGGCKILFGQIIYFRHGLDRKFIFMWHGLGKILSCKHGKLQSTETFTRNSNAIESSIIRWKCFMINHSLISSDSVYYFSFYGIILLSPLSKQMKSRPVITLFQIIRRL